MRACEREQLHLAVCEIRARAGQRDPNDQWRARGQRERDLPLNADVAVKLPIKRKPVKGRLVHQVRDPVRATIAGLRVPLQQRVFVNQCREFRCQTRVEVGNRDREYPIRRDLVVAHPIARDRAADDLENAVTVLREVLKAIGLPNELQEQLRIGERLAARITPTVSLLRSIAARIRDTAYVEIRNRAACPRDRRDIR